MITFADKAQGVDIGDTMISCPGRLGGKLSVNTSAKAGDDYFLIKSEQNIYCGCVYLKGNKHVKKICIK